MPPIHTNYKLTTIRKKLRNAMTKPEIILWSRLKGQGLLGYKFRRQHSVGRYVLDFYCHALHLAIELDGSQHFIPDAIVYDRERTRYLNALNIKVVRFTNTEVLRNLAGVIEALARVVRRRRSSWPPRPSPSSGHPSLDGRGRY